MALKILHSSVVDTWSCEMQGNDITEDLKEVLNTWDITIHWFDIGLYIWDILEVIRGFPGSSVGEESTCNAGDSGLIPELGRSSGEGIGYPFQYSWTFLVAQMVKNLPAKQVTWVWSLGWEDPLEEGIAAHSSILAWRIPMDRGAWRATIHGGIKIGHDWMTKHSTHMENN